MKRDIRQLRFKSIAKWRGDSLACPQAFGGDVFAGCSMGCWWCFCREMEEQLYRRYYDGWSRDLVRPCSVEDYKELFSKAFDTDKEYDDWNIKCLRYGMPFTLGVKAETFCVEDQKYNIVAPILQLFKHYDVPLLIETKSHYVGLKKYLDVLKGMRVAVVVAIMGGSDALNFKLEPGVPHASMRWALVKELNNLGIWTAVKWEPILIGINSHEEILEDYADKAIHFGAKHVCFYNYRTSNVHIAKREFESRGYDYLKLLENSLDENWRRVGKLFFDILRSKGVKCSSPDFVNFPFDSDCESCCGVDEVFDRRNELTFQRACSLIRQNGEVRWSDMERIEFKEPKAFQRMRSVWNGKGQYFSLFDSPEICVVGKENGMNIYARKSQDPHPSHPSKQRGLLY